jgi:hypothetical protein
MLGKLARLLRMLGSDVAWWRDGEAHEVAAAAETTGRVLLTRDRALARAVPGAFFVEYAYPFHQARQVVRAFALDDARAFTRCVEDNGELEAVPPEAVQGAVPPRVLTETASFWRCRTCGKVFWPGTHVERMRRTIVDLLDAPLVRDDHAPDEAAPLGRLEPLLDLHQAMDALFWAHRLALLRDELPAALGHLRRFAMHMARHVDLEEELVLPVYAAAPPASGFPRGGDPRIFRRDHEKILGELDRLERKAEALEGADPGEARDLGRIELLDAERKYVDLLAHHDHRERAFLYPRLVEVMSAAEQHDLLERMLGEAPGAETSSADD